MTFTVTVRAVQVATAFEYYPEIVPSAQRQVPSVLTVAITGLHFQAPLTVALESSSGVPADCDVPPSFTVWKRSKIPNVEPTNVFPVLPLGVL